MTVVPFLPSQTRDRDAALRRILPKLLGLIWDHGSFVFPDGGVALDDMRVGGFTVAPGVFGVSVWTPEAKVFSAWVGDPAAMVRATYWDGRCMLLSWKRGPWEDVIVRARVEPRTVAHLSTAGRV